MTEAAGGDELDLGDRGAGDDCLGKMIRFGAYGAQAGTHQKCTLVCFEAGII